MLELGAEQCMIDGSIDRRAASAPGVADAVVMSTGAVLGREIDEVAAAPAAASSWSTCRGEGERTPGSWPAGPRAMLWS